MDNFKEVLFVMVKIIPKLFLVVAKLFQFLLMGSELGAFDFVVTVDLVQAILGSLINFLLPFKPGLNLGGTNFLVFVILFEFLELGFGFA
ncbi:MAG: hypothetical protein HC880_15295 [Bacteroidia bacterium]|nr:hypothetical protein [Bacteroidia bacterium]